MHDIAKERVDAAIATIDKNLTRQVASGKISEEDRQNSARAHQLCRNAGRVSATPTS